MIKGTDASPSLVSCCSSRAAALEPSSPPTRLHYCVCSHLILISNLTHISRPCHPAFCRPCNHLGDQQLLEPVCPGPVSGRSAAAGAAAAAASQSLPAGARSCPGRKAICRRNRLLSNCRSQRTAGPQPALLVWSSKRRFSWTRPLPRSQHQTQLLARLQRRVNSYRRYSKASGNEVGQSCRVYIWEATPFRARVDLRLWSLQECCT